MAAQKIQYMGLEIRHKNCKLLHLKGNTMDVDVPSICQEQDTHAIDGLDTESTRRSTTKANYAP